MEEDSCMRAAQAAIEVVREECGGMDMEIREIEDGMFMEIPAEAADMIDNAGNSPVPLDNFEQVVDLSDYLRSWLSGIVASQDVSASASSQEYANRVYTFAESIFEDELDFSAEDLRGSQALQIIAQDS